MLYFLTFCLIFHKRFFLVFKYFVKEVSNLLWRKVFIINGDHFLTPIFETFFINGRNNILRISQIQLCFFITCRNMLWISKKNKYFLLSSPSTSGSIVKHLEIIINFLRYFIHFYGYKRNILSVIFP